MTDSVRIVVADDDPDLLELLRINLEAEGHTVKVASDGDRSPRAGASSPIPICSCST